MYGLMVVLAFGASMFGGMLLHKLRDTQLLLSHKDRHLLSLQLLLQVQFTSLSLSHTQNSFILLQQFLYCLGKLLYNDNHMGKFLYYSLLSVSSDLFFEKKVFPKSIPYNLNYLQLLILHQNKA